MFLTEKVPALFKQGKLKLVPAEDGPGLRRVAEATLVIEPFPAQLAHELGEDIAEHLFDSGEMTCSVGIAGGEMHTIDSKAHRDKAARLRKQAEQKTH